MNTLRPDRVAEEDVLDEDFRLSHSFDEYLEDLVGGGRIVGASLEEIRKIASEIATDDRFFDVAYNENIVLVVHDDCGVPVVIEFAQCGSIVEATAVRYCADQSGRADHIDYKKILANASYCTDHARKFMESGSIEEMIISPVADLAETLECTGKVAARNARVILERLRESIEEALNTSFS